MRKRINTFSFFNPGWWREPRREGGRERKLPGFTFYANAARVQQFRAKYDRINVRQIKKERGAFPDFFPGRPKPRKRGGGTQPALAKAKNEPILTFSLAQWAAGGFKAKATEF